MSTEFAPFPSIHHNLPTDDIPYLTSSSEEDSDGVPGLISSSEEDEEDYFVPAEIPELISSDEEERIGTPKAFDNSKAEIPNLTSSSSEDEEEDDERVTFSNEDSDGLPGLISSSDDEWSVNGHLSDSDSEEIFREDKGGIARAPAADIEKRRRVKAKRRSPVTETQGWQKGFLGKTSTPSRPSSHDLPNDIPDLVSSSDDNEVDNSSSSSEDDGRLLRQFKTMLQQSLDYYTNEENHLPRRRPKTNPPEYPRAPVPSLLKKERQANLAPAVVGMCWAPHAEEKRQVTEAVERVEVRCSANCCLHCHQSCWKRSLKFNTADQVTPRCPTPDCWGEVTSIRFLSGPKDNPVCIYSHDFRTKEKVDKEKEKKETKAKKRKKKKKKSKGKGTKEKEEKEEKEKQKLETPETPAEELKEDIPAEKEEEEGKGEEEANKEGEEVKEEEVKQEEEISHQEMGSLEDEKAEKERLLLQRLKETNLSRKKRDEIFKREKRKLDKEFEKRKPDKITEEEKFLSLLKVEGDWSKKETVPPPPQEPKDAKKAKRLAKKHRKQEQQRLQKEKALELLKFSVAEHREPQTESVDTPLPSQEWEESVPIQYEDSLPPHLAPVLQVDSDSDLDLPPHLADLKDLKIPNSPTRMRPSAPSFHPVEPLSQSQPPPPVKDSSLTPKSLPSESNTSPEMSQKPKLSQSNPGVRFLPKTHFGQPKANPSSQEPSQYFPQPSVPTANPPSSKALPSSPFPSFFQGSHSTFSSGPWSSTFPSTSTSTSIDEDDEVPTHLKCPLTGELMREPVIAGDGQTVRCLNI